LAYQFHPTRYNKDRNLKGPAKAGLAAFKKGNRR
jgi:hypothetical protein